ncbi:Fic family protein [Streptomyces flavidovirens]|uniref:Fic family protein n=1 Tax=Streptomyces flavidovirens TaxID=67298 RepID=A0ABW6RIG9_9ACTN
MTGPVPAARDGIADHAAASGPARGEERAERLGAAWRQAYADAARLYLDVAFFHPFDDGNGRAALLALGHLLAAEDIVLGRIAPLTVARYADDADTTSC